jgi:hypothetical protein
MSDKQKKPCIRCLLRETDAKKASQIISEYQKTVPDAMRAKEGLYEERLAICKDCKWLQYGTCHKCGAYVEARAYHKDMHCPLGEKIW